jgi:hypothetical protein
VPRFFFNVYDDVIVLDEDGLDLPDLAHAQREALRSARSLACQQVGRGELHLDHRIEIADERGECLAKVRFVDAIDIRA